MDVRDADGSNVIHQIMAKRISAIDMESRSEVAKNRKTAQQAELEAQQAIDVTKAETERIAGEAQAKSLQAIGIAKAESDKQSGIAKQNAISEIAKSERLTAEQQMEVVKVNEIKQAEIDKEKAIINIEQQKREIEIEAEAQKFKVETDAKAQLFKVETDTRAQQFKVETDASAKLEAQKKEAEAIIAVGEAQAGVIKAKGLSEAEAKKQMELANVTAQTTLAKEIGENESYQTYLIKIREIEIMGEVNKVQYQSLATALNGADLKLLVNSGDVHSGLGKFSDILSSKGASATNGLVEGLKQTPEGAGILALLDRITKNNDADK
jgi:flotillin